MNEDVDSPDQESKGGAYTWATVSAYFGALIALTGVQLISPAYPQMQVTYALSDAEVGLISSTFLIPSIGSALAAGYLAARYGRRLIYAFALLVYGASAPVQMIVSTSEAFFAARIVQGIAFGAILPLSMIVLGDIVRTRDQLRAQATRNLTMGLGDTFFPAIGGLLIAIGDWRVGLVLQIFAVPVAVIAWRTLPAARAQRQTPSGSSAPVNRRIILSAPSVTLQLAGFLRFLFKFGLYAYLPLLLDRNGASPTIIGIALGLSSALTIAVNFAATRFDRLRAPGLLNFISLIGVGIAYLSLAMSTSLALHLIALTLFGLFDAILGLVQNTYLVMRFKSSQRSIITGWVGTSRNLGKAMAPVIMGLLVAGSGLQTTFLVIGLLALIAAPTSRSFRATNSRSD